MTKEPTSSQHPPPVARITTLAVVLLAPILALSLSPWAANGSLWFLGMLPAAIGLSSSPRLAAGAAVLTPTLMGPALLLRELPAVGSMYMALIGAAIGLSALRGWNVMGSFAGPMAALALIGAPQVALASGTVRAESSLAAGLAMMGFVAAGGLWTTLIGRHLVGIKRPKAPTVVPLHTARYFAVALAVPVGVATYIAMTWVTSTNAWWLILTLFVVVQPYYAAASHKVVARVAGTLAGTLLAIAVAELLKHQPVIITSVALVLTVAAAWANLTRPYWVFVLFLTPAVVLQVTGGPSAIVTSALDRALYTTVASVAAIVLLTIGHTLITRKARESPASVN